MQTLRKCARCKTDLNSPVCMSMIIGSYHLLCDTCSDTEMTLLEEEKTVYPEKSAKVKDRLLSYGPPNDYQ